MNKKMSKGGYGSSKSTAATTTSNTATIKEEESPTMKTDFKGLQKALAGKGISFSEFANATDERRKTLLGDDYQETRTKYHWVYDQPVTEEK